MKNLFLLTMLTILGVACGPSPSPIEYGSDACDFCKMTIVDKHHGAEAVSSKGKIFKFDAIECMVQFVEKNDFRDYPILLVNDFTSNGELVDARTSSFLISKAIPSPMGAYLSAFMDEEVAKNTRKEKGGNLFSWEELPLALKQKPVVYSKDERINK